MGLKRVNKVIIMVDESEPSSQKVGMTLQKKSRYTDGTSNVKCQMNYEGEVDGPLTLRKSVIDRVINLLGSFFLLAKFFLTHT